MAKSLLSKTVTHLVAAQEQLINIDLRTYPKDSREPVKQARIVVAELLSDIEALSESV